jgi:uncharacterized membrane protein
MNPSGHLWAIGYDDMDGAAQVREEIQRLADKHCLILLDMAVAMRYPDGCVTLNGEPLVVCPIRGRGFASFLAGLALGAPPLTGAAVGAWVGHHRACAPTDVGIDDNFVCNVEKLMKPGTSTLFVLDQEGDMSALLQGIRGLGGTVLKTNVNLERAKLIQSTLTAPQGDNSDRAKGETGWSGDSSRSVEDHP